MYRNHLPAARTRWFWWTRNGDARDVRHLCGSQHMAGQAQLRSGMWFGQTYQPPAAAPPKKIKITHPNHPKISASPVLSAVSSEVEDSPSESCTRTGPASFGGPVFADVHRGDRRSGETVLRTSDTPLKACAATLSATEPWQLSSQLATACRWLRLLREFWRMGESRLGTTGG